MFDGFDSAEERSAGSRWLVSGGASLVVYVAVIGAFFWLAGEAKAKLEDKEIEVTFKEAVEAPEPASPPPPPPPSVPKDMTVKKVAAVRAPTPMTEPQDIPKGKLEEAEPTSAPVVEVQEAAPGSDSGNAAVIPAAAAAPEPVPAPAAPPAPPPPPVPKRSDPINLPEDADPPEPDSSNEMPAYPEEARSSGLEDMVILKIVVTEKGGVGSVQVLKGKEPFVGVAVAAVKKWKFTPAMVDGEPAAVFRVIKLPFRLRN
ncbi:MAG: hypothetical protein GMKNLPBB_00752 [Myxococcota bacterium]|nr:hypothetical protein [Myxococcota bacterium]